MAPPTEKENHRSSPHCPAETSLHSRISRSMTNQHGRSEPHRRRHWEKPFECAQVLRLKEEITGASLKPQTVLTDFTRPHRTKTENKNVCPSCQKQLGGKILKFIFADLKMLFTPFPSSVTSRTLKPALTAQTNPFFCKGPESKYFRAGGPDDLSSQLGNSAAGVKPATDNTHANDHG